MQGILTGSERPLLEAFQTTASMCRRNHQTDAGQEQKLMHGQLILRNLRELLPAMGLNLGYANVF
jgi:hypothetical protein